MTTATPTKTTAKTFKLAGVSKYKGETTYRFCNGKLNVRTSVLKRNGHEDIQMFELPRKMNKVNAIAWLKDEHKLEALLPTGRKMVTPLTPEQDKEKRAAKAKKAAAKRKKAARAEKAAAKQGTQVTEPVAATEPVVTDPVVTDPAVTEPVTETVTEPVAG